MTPVLASGVCEGRTRQHEGFDLLADSLTGQEQACEGLGDMVWVLEVIVQRELEALLSSAWESVTVWVYVKSPGSARVDTMADVEWQAKQGRLCRCSLCGECHTFKSALPCTEVENCLGDSQSERRTT